MGSEVLHILPPVRGRWERVMIVSDVHVPYHDEELLETVFEFARWYKPHTFIWNGDIGDFYGVSSFAKDPSRAHNFNDEVELCRDVLARGRASTRKQCKHYFIPGNHEHRLERYLMGNANALAPLRCLKLAELLELERHKIQLCPYSGLLLRDDFLVYHGTIVRGATAASAKAESDKAGLSGASGHTHRLGAFRHTDRTGTREWYEGGCLCKTDPEYVVGQPNWAQGFLVGEFDAHSSDMRNVQIVPAAGGRFLFRERVWGDD